MQLFVRGQNLHTLNVDGCDSVLGIKQELALRDGIPVEDQVLLYAGRPLEDGMSLEECELFDQVTLDLGVRLLGGGCPGKEEEEDRTCQAPHAVQQEICECCADLWPQEGTQL
ncbi:ubiquitin-like protein FUBI isoform X2 [Nematostella vectensis]|uniref:ubiquitin-like protein FUBI isoform X2 n=1 Tax=Nematostella vectensis TaxID=45351 RepID=UPI0020776E48|nr:ubiquitin-like protein FUBI isoform X2 [Nematostella vectensis]